MARLSVKSGKFSGLLLEIDKPIVVIGRDQNCDYFFEDPKMSRQHCTIHNNGNEYYIIDNGSSNGVYVNNVKVNEASLHDGDNVVVGNTELEFELEINEKKDENRTKKLVEDSTWGFKKSSIDVQDDSYIELPAVITVDHLKSAYKRMVRLSKISALLQNCSNWYELFSRVANILLDEFKPDSVSIFRVLSNKEFIVFIQKDRQDIKSFRRKVSRKILEDCYKQKMGFVVSDNRKNGGSYEETLRRKAVRSAMCVPVILDNKVEAIIYLDSLSFKRTFSRLDLQLLTGIVSQVTSHMKSILLLQTSISEHLLQSELEVARKIQTMFLNKQSPGIEGVNLSSYSEPAKKVGGDYIDFVKLPNKKVAIVMADVSGKGLPSALMMASFRAHFLTEINHVREPSRVMHNMNKYVWEDLEGRLYVTAVLFIYDITKGVLEYVNAGHPYPLVFRQNDTIKECKTGGFYLGLQENSFYKKGRVHLKPGETLVTYTDGVMDQISEKDEVFGRKRLLDILKNCIEQKPERIVESVIEKINSFLGQEDLFDDMSLIVFRKTKKQREE